MLAPPGSDRVMRADNSLRGIGTATAAGWSTITGGTATAIAISATIGTRGRRAEYENVKYDAGLIRQPGILFAAGRHFGGYREADFSFTRTPASKTM